MTLPLSPLEFPISQSRLIEASAGTGKTFTIATLYVRLVLGHGGPGTRPRPMTPPEILVVTFTEAATKELRDRIRARLAQAARHFRGEADQAQDRVEAGDPLDDLRNDHDPATWPRCARLLELAAAWMDESAVSTIHSWCARMLREHAFDSESLFSQALELDQDGLLQEVAADYWRCFLAGLSLSGARLVRAHWWPSPRTLLPKVKHLVRIAHALGDGQAPQALLDARLASADGLKAQAREGVPDLRGCIEDAIAQGVVDKRKLQARHYTKWLDQLSAWAEQGDALVPDLSDAAWGRLSPEGISQVVAPSAPDHPLLSHPMLLLLAGVRALQAGLAADKRAVLQHAAHWIAQRMESIKQHRALMGPDDLLTRLHAALRAPGGARLAQTIRQQFPVAFIDEFQDTDPVQYGIFDAVYRLAEADPDTAIVLIGDPKQAIYSFRGADIHAYLDARQACGERLYTLQRNYRSTVQAVQATNFVFGTAQARDPRGAFRSTASRGRIGFQDAQAQGRKQTLRIETAQQPALTVWCQEDNGTGQAVANGVARDTMAAAAASEIARLLSLGDAGRAGFCEGDSDDLRALRPADIAVLVSTRAEADAVRRALSVRGVRSVYLSDRDSVYDSAQAGELETWLSACADPEDAGRVRAALATAAMGLTWNELDALHRNERVWSARSARFLDYRTVWREQGVLPMLRHLLHDHGIPARLLGGAMAAGHDSGERALTNFLHLAELLQRASESLEGEHALIRFLSRQRAAVGADTRDDTRQIRLESDAGLVQVVTIFKSKGLEYPLVFLPFGEYARPVAAGDDVVKWHDDEGRLQVSLEAGADELARADEERQAEDLRRLYVALTRARYATWMGVSAVRHLAISAVGHLLGMAPAGTGEADGDGGQAGTGLEVQVQALWSPCPCIRILAMPAAGGEHYRPVAAGRAVGHARSSARVHREHWWIGSYTAIARTLADEDAHAAGPAPADTAHQENFAQMAAEEGSRQEPRIPLLLPAADHPRPHAAGGQADGAPTIHTFPAGAKEGSFLHEVLEWAAQRGFGEAARDRPALRDTVARRCSLRGWSPWVDALTDWVQDFLSCRFVLPQSHGVTPTTLCLSALADVRAELEFWLPVQQVPVRALDSLVRRHSMPGRVRPGLLPAQLNGMLKGFIDLVFEHEGRYYVADYKSNRLGPDAAAYTTEAVEAEVLKSRYELQYVLYLLALHRLLGSRRADYDYDRHIGGAVYFFLRGIGAPGQGLHVEKPPRELIEALDRMFARGAQSADDRPLSQEGCNER